MSLTNPEANLEAIIGYSSNFPHIKINFSIGKKTYVGVEGIEMEPQYVRDYTDYRQISCLLTNLDQKYLNAHEGKIFII